MKTLRAVLACVLICQLLPSAAWAAAASAEEVVRQTTDQVTARLKAQKPELEAHPERIYGLIQELVVPHFDFASMSKWILGRAWSGATSEQRDQFIAQFRTLLVRTYAKALLEYSSEAIRFMPTEQNPESNLVMVKTEVAQSGGGAPIPINYRLHVTDGNWKVVDVTVDGVSLISTYRGSFASEIQKSGLDTLISKLVERNAKLASAGPEAATPEDAPLPP